MLECAQQHDGRDVFFINPNGLNGEPVISHFEGTRHKMSVLALAEAAMEITQRDRLIEEGLVDPVTGLRNRNAFERDLEHELQDAGPGDISLLFLDLDGLKRVNDGESHSLGDEYLGLAAENVATALGDTSRPYDKVYRTGGDEFVVILQRRFDTSYDALHAPNGDSGDLSGLAGRVRKEVDKAITEHDVLGGLPKLGVSIGWSTLEDGDSAAGLIERADKGCHEDKEARYNDETGSELRASDPRLND